ncbi:hypothetical protein RRG08_012381 [Elysia crispata]|uniref:Uncharacterized protein n=1 Tax=Elysia crispata TaxID=231223 RepID=A0AAE0YH13_9GAST|nr:hypothetical protein RRG08_012381 [Elysia crispata]
MPRIFQPVGRIPTHDIAGRLRTFLLYIENLRCCCVSIYSSKPAIGRISPLDNIVTSTYGLKSREDLDSIIRKNISSYFAASFRLKDYTQRVADAGPSGFPWCLHHKQVSTYPRR